MNLYVSVRVAKKASVWKRRDGRGKGWNTLALCVGYQLVFHFIDLVSMVNGLSFRLCLTVVHVAYRFAGGFLPCVAGKNCVEPASWVSLTQVCNMHIVMVTFFNFSSSPI